MSELLEEILSDSNISRALDRVCLNKGAAGVDGITIEEIRHYMHENWAAIKSQIKTRRYRPQPVRAVEIPKPNGGTRRLGIPTVMDRIIQQAMVQKLTPICEPYFADNSYGFRPGRSCEMAIVKVLEYLNDGYIWVVDIDLEKFFDNVPHDRLMSYVHVIINDGDTESLIRKYLKAGIMTNNEFEESKIGTPQGGNLSPLLSNIMLNQLDKELEARGLRYTRYADDCVILVGSEASAKRVMFSISRFIEKKLGLKVNMTKSKITKPSRLKYLGFGFWFDAKQKQWKCCSHEDSVEKFKGKLKKLCSRNWSISLTDRIQRLNWVIRGWINYYAMGNMKRNMDSIDAHLRTMIRVIIWKQWKTAGKRYWGLCKLGCPKWVARKVSQWGNHYYFVANHSCLKQYITKTILKRRGLGSCLDYYLERHSLKFS